MGRRGSDRETHLLISRVAAAAAAAAAADTMSDSSFGEGQKRGNQSQEGAKVRTRGGGGGKGGGHRAGNGIPRVFCEKTLNKARPHNNVNCFENWQFCSSSAAPLVLPDWPQKKKRVQSGSPPPPPFPILKPQRRSVRFGPHFARSTPFSHPNPKGGEKRGKRDFSRRSRGGTQNSHILRRGRKKKI